MAPVLFLANGLGQFSLFVIAEFFIQNDDNIKYLDKWFSRIALGLIWLCIAFIPSHFYMFGSLKLSVSSFNIAAATSMPISILLMGLAYALILLLRRGK